MLDKQKIDDIVHNRIIVAPLEIKHNFPEVLKVKQPQWIAYNAESYLLLAFMMNDGLTRVKKLQTQKLSPFPGLISPDDKTGAAIKVNNSRNLIVKANSVKNAYSFLLGSDSTIIVEEHGQIINTQELGVYEYTVELAFIIARGSEINLANQYDYLDGLIAYAIKTWGSK
jgi:hypothetical protein